MSIFTPKCVISYPHLWEPQDQKEAGKKPRYNCVLLFPIEMDEEDKALLAAMQQAALEVGIKKWGSQEKLQALMSLEPPHQLKLPFSKNNLKQDGTTEKWSKEKFRFSISPWTEVRPGVVSRWADPNDPKHRPLKINDPSKIFAGCIVKCSVNPFAYENSGNRGINFGLGNVQLWQNENVERLDNRAFAEDEFAGETAPEGALSSLQDSGGNGAPASGVASGAKGKALSDLFS